MSEKYFEVGGTLFQEKKGNIEEMQKLLSPAYRRNMTIGWVVLGLGTVLLPFTLLFTAPLPEEDPLHRKVRQIFKNHGSRMAALNSRLSAVSREWIEVFSIEDLVRISDDVGRPILYRNSGSPEEVYDFYVIDEGSVYALDIRKGLPGSFTGCGSGIPLIP